MNFWVGFKSIVKLLDNLQICNSSWMRTPRFKYLELRIDTRDGKCTIKDRYGEAATFGELEAWINKVKEKQRGLLHDETSSEKR